MPPYGYTHVKTPAIAALAADGVVFERAYSHSPQTLPAHAALLSGKLPSENGVRVDEGAAIKPGERLLPQMLRDRGYATAGVVSSALLGKGTGIGQGFEFFESPSLAGSRDGDESETIAERWLASHSTRAFMFLHLDEPHAPYEPPDRFAEFAAYDGEIAYADEIVGRLVKYLKSHQLYDRSTIVLLSDHGEGLGEHGEDEHGLFVPGSGSRAAHHQAGATPAPAVASGMWFSTSISCRRFSTSSRHRCRGDCAAARSSRCSKAPAGPAGVGYSESPAGRTHFGWSAITALTSDRTPAPVLAEPVEDAAKERDRQQLPPRRRARRR